MPLEAAEGSGERISVPAILARLRDLQQRDEEGEERYRDLLQELLDVGSEEAFEALASLIGDPTFYFPGKASVFGDLLKGNRQPVILDATHDILDYCVEHGLTRSADVGGYIGILAERGDRRDVQALLDLLRLDEGPCRVDAAERLDRVSDRSLGPELLSLVEEGHPLGGRILAGLARWEDPFVQARVGEMIQDGELSIPVRVSALDALAETVDPLGLPAHLARFYDPEGGEEDRLVFILGLHDLYENRALDRDVLTEHVQPFLLEGLGDPSPSVVESTLTVIANHELATPAILQALRRLSAEIPENLQVRRLIYEAEHEAR